MKKFWLIFIIKFAKAIWKYLLGFLYTSFVEKKLKQLNATDSSKEIKSDIIIQEKGKDKEKDKDTKKSKKKCLIF